MFLALPNKSLSKITGFLLLVTQFHFQRIYYSQQRLGFLFVQLVGFFTIRQTSVYFYEKKKRYSFVCTNSSSSRRALERPFMQNAAYRISNFTRVKER